MSKEQVYDEKIFPLMGEVIRICKEHKIAMLADFALDDVDLHCTTALLADEFGPSEEQIHAYRLFKPKKSLAVAITEETKPDGLKKITIRGLCAAIQDTEVRDEEN